MASYFGYLKGAEESDFCQLSRLRSCSEAVEVAQTPKLNIFAHRTETLHRQAETVKCLGFSQLLSLEASSTHLRQDVLVIARGGGHK